VEGVAGRSQPRVPFGHGHRSDWVRRERCGGSRKPYLKEIFFKESREGELAVEKCENATRPRGKVVKTYTLEEGKGYASTTSPNGKEKVLPQGKKAFGHYPITKRGGP